MKFSYLFYEPVPEPRQLAKRMRQLAELGYDGVELAASHPLGYEPEALAAISKETGLPVVSFLSGWSYGNEKLCLASRDKVVRDRAVQRLTGYVEMASSLGAIVVVGLMQGLRSDEPDAAAANERIAAALSRVAKAAEACGGTIVMEPVNHLQVGFNHTAGEMSQLIERIGSPAVRLMLDTIHMSIEEQRPLETIRRYGAKLAHFHLCESNGGLPGSGNLDYASVLAALDEAGYQRFVSIKIYRHAPWQEAAGAAISFLEKIGWKKKK
jgi:D-psicose/D-tagatose/L-ribulose 3-epimerase